MKVVRLFALLVPAITVTASSAGAEGPAADFTRDGWYVGARGVYGIEDFNTGGSGIDAQNGWGFNARGGYRFLRFLAIDVEFEYFNSFDLKHTGVKNASVSTYNVGLNLKGYPTAWLGDGGEWWQRVQPYFNAGTAGQWIDFDNLTNSNAGGFAGRLGGGLEIYITKNFVTTLDATYVYSTGDVKDFRHLSTGVGFEWRFATPDYK